MKTQLSPLAEPKIKPDSLAPEGPLMVRFFAVENYRSFGEKTVLNFKASAEKMQQGWALKRAGKDYLALILGISGPSGSGKTAMLKALAFVTHFMAASFSEKGESISGLKSFEHNSKPCVFEMESEDEAGKIYLYTLEVLPRQVLLETLRVRVSENQTQGKVIFYRKRDKIISAIRDFEKIKKSGIGLRASVLSAFLHQNIGTAWEKIGVGFGNVKAEGGLSKERFLEEALSFYEKSAYSRQAVETFLKKFDPTLEEINLTRENGTLKAYFRHKREGRDSFWLEIEEESGSLQYLYSLFSALPCFFDLGGLFWIDQIEAEMHPDITQKLLKCFADPEMNKASAQLIFT